MKIQPIRQQVEATGAPRVRAPLDINTGQAAGIGTLSGALDVFAQIAQAEQKYVDARHVVQMESDMALDMQAYTDELKGLTYDELVVQKNERLEEIKTKYEEVANSHSERVKRMWQPKWEDASTKFLLNANEIKTEKLRQETIGAGIQYAKLKQQEAIEATLAGGEAGRQARLAAEMAIDQAFNLLQQDWNVDASTIESWKDSTKRRIDIEVDSIRVEERRLKNEQEAAEKAALKQTMDNNYSDAVVLYSKGKLTKNYIERLLESRQITAENGKALILKLEENYRRGKEGAEEDNALVLGSLAEKIGLKVDVSDELDAAFKSGQVKTSTYLSMKARIGNEQYQKGMDILVRSLAPGPADRWSFDRNAKFGEAVTNYNLAVDKGQDSQKAAMEIIERNTSDLRRSWNGLAKPRFADGDRKDPKVIADAEAKTVEAFMSGAITEEEFNMEAALLEEHSQLLENMARSAETVDAETEARIKANKDR